MSKKHVIYKLEDEFGFAGFRCLCGWEQPWAASIGYMVSEAELHLEDSKNE